MSDAQALYDQLCGEAYKFAAVSTLSLDDVRQTLYVMCLEHTTGQDAFSPLLGTPKSYIMGRLWGLVERWRPMPSLEDRADDEDDRNEGHHRLPEAAQVPGVDEVLIAAAQRLAEERIRDDLALSDRTSLQGLPTAIALVTHCNRPVSEIARLLGKNRWRLRKAARQHLSGDAAG